MTRNRRAFLLAAVLLAAAALPIDAAAQGRRVVRRPSVRTGVAVARPFAYRPIPYRPYYRSYYYSPAFYGFYGGFASWYGGYGWYPYYDYAGPYPYAYPYGYAYAYRPYYDYSSAAQIRVRPREAQVFIDGHFVGTVDDFDGWLQRLHVAPGEHDLDVYLPGYRTFSQKVLFRPGATIRIDHVMQPLGTGEAAEPRPSPRPRAAQAAPRRSGTVSRQPQDTPPPARAGGVESHGAIAVRVQPSDAEVLIDGERWDSPDPGSITVELAEGDHRVEVRKDGFRTYSAEVSVRRGETSSVNVSLIRR